MPSDLAAYTSLAQWAAQPPHVVGAAQAWTKRLVDRFGPLPPGTVAEDLVMVFRALGSGGAITLREPLVQYRRGGISRRRRKLYASDVIERLLKNNRHALVETEQMLKDARLMGRYDDAIRTYESAIADKPKSAAPLSSTHTTGRGAESTRALPSLRASCKSARDSACSPVSAPARRS